MTDPRGSTERRSPGSAVSEAYRRRAQARRCAMCRRSASQTKVLRFGLRATVRDSNGRQANRGAGGINLCELCWRAVTSSREKAPRRHFKYVS